MMKDLSKLVFGVCIFFLTQACDSGPGNGASDSTSSVSYSKYNSEVFASATRMTLGSSVTVSLILKDERFQLIKGAAGSIRFYNAGGTATGVFSAVSEQANGTYSSVFTSLNPGSATTLYAKVNGEDVTPARGSPTIAVLGGLPKTLTVMSGNAQTGPGTLLLPLPFTLLVKDESDSVLSGAIIDWRVTTGGGSVTYSASASGVDGLTSSQLIMGSNYGVHTVVATARGTSVTATFTATANAIPFTHSWTFNLSTAAEFAYDPMKISFSTNSCQLASHPEKDQNNSSEGFGSATLSNLVWDSARTSIRLSNLELASKELSTTNWTPHPEGLLSVWHLNEPAGTVGASSVADGAGTIRGTPNNVQFGKLDHLKSAASFDGTSSNIGFGSNFNFTSSPFSFSFWLYLNSYTTDTPYAPVVFYKGGYLSSGYYAQVQTDGRLSFVTNQSGTLQATDTGTGTFPLREWRHVVISRMGSIVKIYVNGVDATTSAASHADPSSSSDPFYLGLYSGASIHMNGSMDEFAVWNTNLSSADASSIYQHQRPLHAGTLISRVFNALTPSANWTGLSWITALPFAKELPDYASGALQNESSNDYSALVGANGTVGDNNLMSGLTGLWHFNELVSGTAPGGNDFSDSSGNSGHIIKSGNVSFGVTGKLQSGFSTDGTSGYASLSNPVSLGAVNYQGSISFWAKGHTYISTRRESDQQGTFAYLETLETGLNYTNCDLPYAPYCNTLSQPAILSANEWNHFVFTANGSGSYQLAVNGKVISRNFAFSTLPGNFTKIELNRVHNHTYGDTYSQGSFDEMAIWNRPLDPKEILQLYRRGSNRLKYQVRVCSAVDCSDDASGANWKGPNGTVASYFSELNNSLKTSPNLLFTNFTAPPTASQYFQYKAVFESDDVSGQCDYGIGTGSCSPELKSVSIGPGRLYDSTWPTVITKVGSDYQNISSMVETLGTACSGQVKYNIGAGATFDSAIWYYWAVNKGPNCSASGSGAWCPSNGISTQTNSSSETSAHIGLFAAKVGSGKAFFKAYLGSDGITPCDLRKIDVNGQR